MKIDAATIILSNFVIALFFCFAYLVYALNQKTYPGFRRWVLATFCIAIGLFFLIARGERIPLWMGIFATNTLIAMSAVFRLDAVNRFMARTALNPKLYLTPLAVGTACLFFHFVIDLPIARHFITSVFLLVFLVPLLRTMVIDAPKGGKVLYYLAAGFITARILAVAAQFFSWLTIPHAPATVNELFPAIYHMVILIGEVGLGVVFLLMNTQRTDTSLTEAYNALKDSEGRYRGLVDAAFEGIVITENATIIEANPNFCRMFHCDPDAIAGSPAVDFVVPEDRPLVRERMLSGSEEPYQVRGLRKDGTRYPIEIQAKMFSYKGEQIRISALMDISDRIKAEKERARNLKRLEAFIQLSVKEFNTKDDLVEYALEECVSLTDSKVGYLHFLNADQETLYLYQWSSSALENCTAAKTPHYPLKDAGVWADCVRVQKPVIHNDYPRMDGRKGVPEGHFPILRHMSVPIFDGRTIVGVIGVGNRETPYEEFDAKQISLYANNMWQLYKHKRSEDELQRANLSLASAHAELKQKNEALHLLSNTDTLTRVLNRRAIIPMIEKEMKRCRRSGHPVSLLIFDLDHFKLINDRHGHAVGDRVLTDVARTVKENIRATDAVARWGGEEFIILASDTTAEKACDLSEKLRTAISLLTFDPSLRVTASFGVAAFAPEGNFQNWYERADRALYRAKTSGRNCVVSADSVEKS